MPIIKQWNKLVRDKIPDTLAERDILSHIHIIKEKSELLDLLINKSYEEALEIKNAIQEIKNNNLEDVTNELADLYEVSRGIEKIYDPTDKNKTTRIHIQTINNVIKCVMRKYNIEEEALLEVAGNKRKKRGGFDRGVYLHQTIEWAQGETK